MKKSAHTSDIELSHQELKGLELHFKQITNDTLVTQLEKTPLISFDLTGKAVVDRTVHGDEPTKIRPKPLQIEPKEGQMDLP